MRAGAYTIHQSLTAEAAAVLKLALGLAHRRGHAQATPLHVAFALLTGPAAPPLGAFSSSSSSSSPAAAYGLLKRACLRSHPAHAHPLQCRALELCFNVALNRLPTSAPPHSPPGSSFASSLIQPSPTLSNALVAALKRAQANQRRGCVELHHPPPTTAQQQQQPPLLAIKVELDQLVISILDDPSVSRVMREAGLSSATVKTNLEEETALMPPPSSSPSTSSPPPPPTQATVPLHFFLDPSTCSNLGMWPVPGQEVMSCKDGDVRAVLEVMVRKPQGRRGNPVVVGDSVSMAEAVAGELLRRLERGDVPEELAGAHLLKLQLSYVHVRLMSRADVDARAAELRRGADAAQLHRGGGLVVYVGDLRWALDEEPHNNQQTASSYSPVEHMVAELGRFLDDLRASRGRAWLVATASYQTYMRWQQRRRRQPPSLEAAWALQAVLVPTGGCTGLALNNLHTSASAAAGVQLAMVTTRQPGQRQSPFAMAPHPSAFAERDGQQAEKLVLCAECSKNYEREASLVQAEADAEGPRASLPAWLVPVRPPPVDQAQHKDKYLVELKRKWSRLCRKLHLCVDPPCPWWSGPCMPLSRPSIAGMLGLEGLMAAQGKSSRTSEWSPQAAQWGLTSLREPACHDVVGTALALGNLLPLSDTATSDEGSASGAARELERRLRTNIPWQPAAVATEIAEAVAGQQGDEEKASTGVWLYVKGSDHAAVRRAAAVIAAARCSGAADHVVVCADTSRFSCAEEFCLDVVSRVGGRKRIVLVIGDVERAPADVVDCLAAASKSGALKNPSSGRELDLAGSVVILTTSMLTGSDDVISLRLWSEEDDASCDGDLKRKPDADPAPTERKRQRHDHDTGLDLNIDLCDAADDSNDDDEEEAIPSDITHEGSVLDDERDRTRSLLAPAVVITLNDDERAIRGHIRARLARALGGKQHQQPGGAARVDDEAVEALAAASGRFLDETLERWATEVLEPVAATIRNGGKGNVVVLGVGRGGGGGGGARQATGFMGSVLPSRVHVD